MAVDEPHGAAPEDQPSRFHTARRWVRTILGFTVILIGLVLAIPGVPGPGLLIMIAGLAILATEYLWARRYLNRIKDSGDKLSAFLFRKKKPKDPDDNVK